MQLGTLIDLLGEAKSKEVLEEYIKAKGFVSRVGRPLGALNVIKRRNIRYWTAEEEKNLFNRAKEVYAETGTWLGTARKLGTEFNRTPSSIYNRFAKIGVLKDVKY